MMNFQICQNVCQNYSPGSSVTVEPWPPFLVSSGQSQCGSRTRGVLDNSHLSFLLNENRHANQKEEAPIHGNQVHERRTSPAMPKHDTNPMIVRARTNPQHHHEKNDSTG